MLRVAVPNKGSLHGPATELLTDAGYRVQQGDRTALFVTDTANGVQVVFLRPIDIARNIGAGVLDVGITGRDLVAATSTAATELLPLGFGASRFCFAAPPGSARSLADLHGKRIATSFASLVEKAAAHAGIDVVVVELDGAVETAVELGLADAIADVVETGASLHSAGLTTVGDVVLESEAILVCGTNRILSDDREHAVEILVRRLRGVLIAREYMMIDYNCPTSVLPAAKALTPGIEAPTIAPLDEDGWIAVRAMVRREQAQSLMDQLWSVGARAILAMSVEASRL